MWSSFATHNSFNLFDFFTPKPSKITTGIVFGDVRASVFRALGRFGLGQILLWASSQVGKYKYLNWVSILQLFFGFWTQVGHNLLQTDG